ncbi:protein giant [Microplitis demolitor]|uniref:protein giant n=1 Tax=Microplitis demolitor TaxID=69319 RepID=UPI0004CDCA2E|nr:protein giant [Microplitis demolitor]
MDTYVNSSAKNDHALDYTSTKQVLNEKSEMAVLDLSCKKDQLQDSQIASFNLSPVSLEARSVSPSSESTNGQHHQHQQQQQHHRHYDYHDYHNHDRNSSEDEERKSPESRSYMVTPPSESDSPKKPRYQAISPQTNSQKAELAQHYYPLSSPTLSVNIPMIPPVPQPVLPLKNNSIPYVQQALAPTTNMLAINPKVSEQACTPDGKKAPRPFKAYPKDPLALTGPTELMYDHNSKEAYNEFRKKMLESVRKSNDGTNIKMRRLSKNSNLPTSTIDDKDIAYWERRRKNNEAAKRSRDARRAKEDEIAIRAAFLEQENMKLKYEIIALRNETSRLRCMVYPS